MIYFMLLTYAVFSAAGGLPAGRCLWQLFRGGPYIERPPQFGIRAGGLPASIIMLFIFDQGPPGRELFVFFACGWWIFLIAAYVISMRSSRTGSTEAASVGLRETTVTDLFVAAVEELNPGNQVKQTRWGCYFVDSDTTRASAYVYFLTAMGAINASGPGAASLLARIVDAMNARLKKWPERVSARTYLYLIFQIAVSVGLATKFILILAPVLR